MAILRVANALKRPIFTIGNQFIIVPCWDTISYFIKVFTDVILFNFVPISVMENILAMVEGPRTSEITSFDQIDQNLFQELLAKSSVWDFYEISKEEYMNKDDSEKKSLIIKFYNHMVKGKAWLFGIYCFAFWRQILFSIWCIASYWFLV